jgi:signal recognition particle receptor subunit beta
MSQSVDDENGDETTLSIDRGPADHDPRVIRDFENGREGMEMSPGDRLGRELAEIVAATSRLADELRPMLDSDAATALDVVLHDGRNDACRIAVIGQVKAGKSTLINALIRRPGFLPADVNPWTAVVTNLHFGRPSDAGAVYQFFDELDWQHLAAGGRLFELSQRLGIELDAYMLANQVRQMRERAEQRLGSQFKLLLGKQHRFEQASAEVLERYVCVGDLDSGPAGGPTPDAGRFADITKSADLYFDLDPFACPVTIVDTPGTNDPFLVRDDISRDALKSADAYVVVLNAQQALSSSDLDLLRLLHGLQKSRLVVFINRIDLLANPVEDGAAVAAHIRTKLTNEFPGASIPIVAGSALWAQSAAMPEDAAAKALRGRKGLPDAIGGDPAAWRVGVMRASGLDELSALLSRLIVRGPAMLRLQRRQNQLREIMSKLDLAMRGELLLLELRVSASSEDEREATQRRTLATETLRRLNAVSADIAARVEATTADLQRAQGTAIRRLNTALRDVIRHHAAAARAALLNLPRFSRQDHVWRYPTLPLRQELERTFQSIYWEAAGRLRGIERTANAEILGKIGNLVPANEVIGEDAPIHSIDPEPSISALGQTVAVELDSQWRAWWRLWQGNQQQAEELEQILLMDFTPVVEALVSAAEAEIVAHVSISVDRFSQLGRDLIAMLNRRKLDVEAERRGDMIKKPAGPANETSVRQKQLEQSIETCAGISYSLKSLISRCAALSPAPEPPAGVT